MSHPQWKTCSVHTCDHPALDWDVPYCRDCVPIPDFVSNAQVAQAKMLLRRGATLYQAAKRVAADPRDLDAALWKKLGERSRPVAQF